jgi:hypothetical protein
VHAKKRAASRRRSRGVKQGPSKATSPGDAKEYRPAQELTQPPLNAIDLVHQLQTLSLDSDPSTSRRAFDALAKMLSESLAWLHTLASLHPMWLGALRRRLPENDAWAKYEAGEHVGAWAGGELARLYRQMQADLRSRSKHSVNRLRHIRYGFQIGKFAVPENRWFCAEYARKIDYRPTGEMAVWTARKIEELRRIKENRSQWLTYARIEIAENRLRLRHEREIEDELADLFRSDLVEGEVLQRLDDLPVFGTADTGDFDIWRKFLRRRLLTPKPCREFNELFPNSRRKLDGVVAATLGYTWHAVQHGGNVILP